MSSSPGQLTPDLQTLVRIILDHVAKLDKYCEYIQKREEEYDYHASCVQKSLRKVEYSECCDRERLAEALKWFRAIAENDVPLAGFYSSETVGQFIELLNQSILQKRANAGQLNAEHLYLVLSEDYCEAEGRRVADVIDKIYDDLLNIVGTGLVPELGPPL